MVITFAKRRNAGTTYVSRPHGSTSIGHAGTDEGSPSNTINPASSKTSPEPKHSDKRDEQDFTELIDMFPEIMNDASFSTNESIVTSLRRAGEIIKSKQSANYWMTEEGQAIFIGKLNDRGGPPSGLCAFDYTEETKAMLYAEGRASG